MLVKAAQVLYIAAPSTSSDLHMMLPWALSILLLQVAGAVIVTMLVIFVTKIILLICFSHFDHVDCSHCSTAVAAAVASHPYSAACYRGTHPARSRHPRHHHHGRQFLSHQSTPPVDHSAVVLIFLCSPSCPQDAWIPTIHTPFPSAASVRLQQQQ